MTTGDARRPILWIMALLAGAMLLPLADAGAQTAAGTGAGALPRDACVQCHMELDADMDDDEKLFTHFAAGEHVRIGLSCADCHGGDPTAFDDEDAAMWEADSFVGTPDKEEIPEFCGKCHSDPTYMRRYSPGAETDQVKHYFTSQHGIKLREGEERVAACTDCHGVHGIYAIDNPLSTVYPLNVPGTCGKCHSDAEYMAGTGLDVSQFEEYSSSVHGVALLERRDIGAPACNDCHGNHGAAPPEAGGIANICGHCHINNQRLFEQSHLRQLFADEHYSLCIVCHEKHAIVKPDEEFLNWHTTNVCGKCHEDGHSAQQMSMTFYAILDSLKTGIAQADSLIHAVEMKGLEASDLQVAMEDAHRALIQTRTNVHAFDEAILRESATEGQEIAQATISGARELLEHFRFRQRGLFGASLIITFLVVAIWLKLRQIEKAERE